MAGILDDREAVRSIFGKVITLVLLASISTALLLSVANDMYAFFKPQGEVLLRIDDPCSLSDFSQLLESHGVLLNPHVFSFYVKRKKKASLIESFSGELLLNRSMSYREILQSVQKS